MSEDQPAQQSLWRWMMQSPWERMGKGLLLPIAAIGVFIAILLVNVGERAEYVYYCTDTHRTVSRRAYQRDDTGAIEKRVRVVYWEKWAGFEGEAIDKTVAYFNRTNDKKIYVDITRIGDITEKIRTATAGGNPPDLAGLFSIDIPVFAAQNALIPLDDMMDEAGIGPHTYIDAYYRLGVYRDKVWALPTTPSTWALHWNKNMFREAGLDPDQPPRTLEELEEFARKLTKVDEDGNIVQVGFLPTEPGWWKYSWGYWFGGRLWDGEGNITANSPENLEAMRWVRRFADGEVYEGLGYRELDAFKGTFGEFASSGNAFFDGRVAMVRQGVWMAKFIEMFAPDDFEFGVAPFPSKEPGLHETHNAVTIGEADMIGIPQGARRPEEAFEFIKFLATPEGMEILCGGHGKNSPLVETSEGWIEDHPNPYIDVFTELAESPRCYRPPPIGIWQEYLNAWARAFDDIWTRRRSPERALDELQAEMQRRLDHELERKRALGLELGAGDDQ